MKFFFLLPFHHLVKESLLFSSSVRTKGERHTKKNRWRLYVVQCIRVVVVVVCGTPLLLLHSVSLSFAGHKRFRVGVQLGERECPAVIIRHFGHRRFGRLDGVWSVVSISLCKPTGQDARPLSLRKNEEEDFHQIPFQPAVQRRPQSEYEIFIRLAFPIFSFNSKVQEFFFFSKSATVNDIPCNGTITGGQQGVAARHFGIEKVSLSPQLYFHFIVRESRIYGRYIGHYLYGRAKVFYTCGL